MPRQTLPDSPPQTSLIKRIASSTPIVLCVYAATSLALGLDLANPMVVAVGLTATGAGFVAGDVGIRKLTTRLEGLL